MWLKNRTRLTTPEYVGFLFTKPGWWWRHKRDGINYHITLIILSSTKYLEIFEFPVNPGTKLLLKIPFFISCRGDHLYIVSLNQTCGMQDEYIQTGEGKTLHPVDGSKRAVRSTMSCRFRCMPVSSSTCHTQKISLRFCDPDLIPPKE